MMNLSRRGSVAAAARCAALIAGLQFACAGSLVGQQAGKIADAPESVCEPARLGSPYIPVDSWVYPAMLRLYSLGYVDTMYLDMRPWTRSSVMHMLEQAEYHIENSEDEGDAGAEEAREIYESVSYELQDDMEGPCGPHQGSARVESVYEVGRAISGTPLHDSYHLGSTIVNDYGRPIENGFNDYTGASAYASMGRFAAYARWEFQGAPSAAGYSAGLAQALSSVDSVPYYETSSTPPYGQTTTPYNQATIPRGPIGTATQGRLLEAYVSYQYLNHVFSFGKHDQWLGPGVGGSMAFSNNAQNFYGFEINRIEPLRVPLLSRLTGPFRYELLIGALRGHNYMPSPAYQANPSPNIPNVINPGNPWVHVEKFSFRPTKNLEFGFERTVLWGGEGHSPINLHNFFHSFFSAYSPAENVKFGPDDPGARFSSFDFSYRLPFVRNWLTLYTDSEVHDDVSPIDAPRRAAYRPGIYLSHFPGIPKLDLRVEAASTDPSASTVGARQYGHFMYWEVIEVQGYTNQGQLFGDWIGREDKGGQAWLTYHLSGNEWIQVNARNQKATKDFIPGSTTQTSSSGFLIPGGTTLNDLGFQAVKRIGKDLEVRGSFTLEHWKAPIYLPGQQTVTTTNIQLTWFPQRKVSF
jgi:Capsule assembly protein Wzi